MCVKSRFQFSEDLLAPGDGKVVEWDSKPAQTLIPTERRPLIKSEFSLHHGRVPPRGEHN
jgi:hypothetical protein